MSVRSSQGRKFSYHGNAVGFGATLTSPCCDVIPSMGGVSLAPSGGEATARVGPYNYKGLISFEEISSYVSGAPSGGGFSTLAMVTIHNLNIAGVIRAETITARVTSDHTGDFEDEGRVVFTGSSFDGLRIGNYRVAPQLDVDTFSRHAQFDAYANSLVGSSCDEYRQRGRNSFWDVSDCEGHHEGHQHVPKSAKRGHIQASLLTGLDGIDVPECRDPKSHIGEVVCRDGYGLHVEEFGTIYFAEVLMKRGERRLTMLRFDLGCGVEGKGSAGAGEGNGTPIGP